MRAALVDLLAMGSGTAVSFATWNIELGSLPPACQPCTGPICNLALCYLATSRLVTVASLAGLVATASILVALRRIVR